MSYQSNDEIVTLAPFIALTGGMMLRALGGTYSRNGVTLSIPTKASMTLEEADAWLKNAAGQIEKMLDKNTSLEEQAKLAADLSVQLTEAARLGLADPNLASELNLRLIPKTYEQLRLELANKEGGAAGSILDQKVIDAAIQQTKEMGCFVAGTLVHTQDGLKPIEQIQVGDLVLSRHESGEGELCYQPVTRTFQYEDREMYYVSWQVLEKETLKPKQIFGEMAVTGAHPIWVKRVVEERADTGSDGLEEIPHEINRWMSIDEIYLWYWKAYWDFEWNRGLGRGQAIVYFELFDGQPARLGHIQPILQSDDPDVGVGFDDCIQWLRNADTEGQRVDFRSEAGIPHSGLSSSDYGTLDNDRVAAMLIDDLQEAYDHPNALDFTKRSGGYLPMRRRVYNLEVANTHTYFVGDLGLWVHNTSGVVAANNVIHASLPVGVFNSKKDFWAAQAKTADGKLMGILPDLTEKVGGYNNRGQTQCR